jgi:hypothetical protein
MVGSMVAGLSEQKRKAEAAQSLIFSGSFPAT